MERKASICKFFQSSSDKPHMQIVHSLSYLSVSYIQARRKLADGGLNTRKETGIMKQIVEESLSDNH